MKKGLSCRFASFWSAIFTISNGSVVSEFWLKNSKASLLSWYPAAIVVSIAFCSFSFSIISIVFLPARGFSECYAKAVMFLSYLLFVLLMHFSENDGVNYGLLSSLC